MLILDSTSARRKLSRPRLLYGISDRNLVPELPLTKYIELLLSTPADIIQWREKDWSARESLSWIRSGIEQAHVRGKLFIINSLTEVALNERADGVHLPSSSNIAEAVRLRARSGDDEFLIGKSVHSVAEGIRAEREGADYILLSPVFNPLSKDPAMAPLGLQALKQAVVKLQIPVFALGGINRARFAEVFSTGVRGVAGISWLHQEIAKLEHGPDRE